MDSDRTPADYGEYKVLPNEREDYYDGYEEKPDFTFDEKKHVYKLDGKPMTGVTSVIGVLAKPALIGWAAKMAVEYLRENGRKIELSDDEAGCICYEVTDKQLEEAKSAHTKKKEKAGEHGTDAHALVEDYVNDCIKNFEGKPQAIALYNGTPVADINKFIEWSFFNVDKFLFSERRMFNRELFVAGTADFAYVGKDGKRYMADFKTSSGIYGIDYWLQVAAYRFLAESSGDAPYDGATIVRLGKDGKFEVQQVYEYETYKEAFMCCLTLYRAQASIKDLVVKTP